MLWRHRSSWVFLVIVGWGCLMWMLERPSIHIMQLRLTYSLSPRRLFSQALILSGRARFITWCLKCSFSENAQWSPRHFCECQACLGYGLAPEFTFKKALNHTHPVGGIHVKYLLPLDLNTLQLAMFPSTWIRLGVPWLYWLLVKVVWHGCQGSTAFMSCD